MIFLGIADFQSQCYMSVVSNYVLCLSTNMGVSMYPYIVIWILMYTYELLFKCGFAIISDS